MRNNSATFKRKQNLQLKISSSRNHMHYQILQLSKLSSVVQTQSTHLQSGTLRIASSNIARNIVNISMQTMQRFSSKDVMFPFSKENFVCKPRQNVFGVCMYSRRSVCVCCWKALFLVKHLHLNGY